MERKRTAFLIATFMLLAYALPVTGAQAKGGGDMADLRAKRAITTVGNFGPLSPGGSLGPDQPVTRAELVGMLVRAGWIAAESGGAGPTFQDVGRTNPAYPSVEAAVYASIVRGSPGSLFRPNRPVTGSETAAMAGRLLAAQLVPGVPSPADDRSIDWLAVLKEKGILRDGDLAANRAVTGAEAAVVILRLKEVLLTAQIARERRWISGAQSRAGYVTLADGRPDLNPYFENLTEMALLGRPQYLGGVKRYLEWTLSHLNHPDVRGLNGTIYDRRLVNGVVQTVYSYDSADSYAGTLLSLAAGYYYSSGDAGFIRQHYRELNTVAEVITTLQEKDGLIRARPGSQFAYLMDNSESYRGLADWSSVLAALGLSGPSVYASRAARIKKGILGLMWDENSQSFAWAVDEAGKKSLLSPRQAYPGVFAQIYPVALGVTAPNSRRAVLGYQELNRELPGWSRMNVGDPFPWEVLGYAAAKMGDWARADRFLAGSRAAYILSGRKYPWSTYEDAFYIRASEALEAGLAAGLD